MGALWCCELKRVFECQQQWGTGWVRCWFGVLSKVTPGWNLVAVWSMEKVVSSFVCYECLSLCQAKRCADTSMRCAWN